MERDRTPAYVSGLEQNLRNTLSSLKGSFVQLQEMCQRTAARELVTPSLTSDIRKAYKEIQDQLTKVKGIQQILQARYGKWYHRDPTRDREIMEIGFVAKRVYLKFESILSQREVRQRTAVQGRVMPVPGRLVPVSWFRVRENQTLFLRILEALNTWGDPILRDSELTERRRVVSDRFKSFSFFVFSGEGRQIDVLQSRLRLRKCDLAERSENTELRGVLTHRRPVSLPELTGIVRRFMGGSGGETLKCLLVSVQSAADLEKEVLPSTGKILQEIPEGEIRTLFV